MRTHLGIGVFSLHSVGTIPFKCCGRITTSETGHFEQIEILATSVDFKNV